MNRSVLVAVAQLMIWAAPAAAQEMDHSMHGMTTPSQPQASAPADPHAGHAGPSAAPAAETPPPPSPADHAAEHFFSREAMARARRGLEAEHGGTRVSKVMADIAEYQAREGDDGYRWGVEAWYGGDLNRLVLKSEGEGAGGNLEGAELQALYSRAIGRYTDLQLGLRHDFEPSPSRTYLALGVEALLPYWFEAEGAVFLSEKGDVLARAEASYDVRLSQRLVLQPSVELEFAAQDSPQTGTGSGLSTAELGLRLRYEIRREFAPYVGVAYERAFGGTADFVRAEGEDIEATHFVVGVRAWF